MKQSSEILSMNVQANQETVNTSSSTNQSESMGSVLNQTADKFFAQYNANLELSQTLVVNFIFENRGFFIRHARNQLNELLENPAKNHYTQVLNEIKKIMIGVEKVDGSFCRESIAVIDQQIKALQVEKQQRVETLEQKRNRLQGEREGTTIEERLSYLLCKRFVFKLFSGTPLEDSDENFVFSKHSFAIFNRVLKEHPIFSRNLYLMFFWPQSGLAHWLRFYNEACQDDLSKLIFLVKHFAENRDFYVYSKNLDIFEGFLNALASDERLLNKNAVEDVLVQMHRFSEGVIAQFHKLETADLRVPGNRFSENAYTHFLEILHIASRDDFNAKLKHFLMLNPHVANYFCKNLSHMENFCRLWQKYKQIKTSMSNSERVDATTVEVGKSRAEREIQIDRIIDHLFKNRDIYFKISRGDLDRIIDQNPHQNEPAHLKDMFADLNEELFKEWLAILGRHDPADNPLIEFLIKSLQGQVVVPDQSLFSERQAQDFKQFLLKQTVLVDILSFHYFESEVDNDSSDNEEEIGGIESLMREIRYLYLKDKNIFYALLTHMNKNAAFYFHLVKELDNKDSGLSYLFPEKYQFLQKTLEQLMLPEAIDVENNGFNSVDSPKRCWLELLNLEEADERWNELQNFMEHNSSLANFLCDHLKELQVAAEKYQVIANKIQSRKRAHQASQTELIDKVQSIKEVPQTNQAELTGHVGFFASNENSSSGLEGVSQASKDQVASFWKKHKVGSSPKPVENLEACKPETENTQPFAVESLGPNSGPG